MATYSCHSNQSSYPIWTKKKKKKNTQKNTQQQQQQQQETYNSYALPVDAICEIRQESA